MSKKLLILISVLVIAGFVLSACASPTSVATEAPAVTEAPVVTEAPAATEAPVATTEAPSF